MTATNHAFTGAVVVLAVKQPALAVPLAVLSHFVLDAIPHFGIHEDDVIKRNGHWLFKSVVAVDVTLVLIGLVAIPWLLHAHVNPWLVLIGMLLALAPDAVWIYRFFYEVRTKLAMPHGWFARFHQRIQWSEKPWGIFVEIVWLMVMTATAAVLA